MYRCRRTDEPIPQLVLGQPSSWPASVTSSATPGDSNSNYCSLKLAADSFGDDVTSEPAALDHVTGSVFIKATTDHKYDGTQVRNLIVSMSRRVAGELKKSRENITEMLLQLPV